MCSSKTLRNDVTGVSEEPVSNFFAATVLGVPWVQEAILAQIHWYPGY